MRKILIVSLMLASCSFIFAQSDSTIVDKSIKNIGNDQKPQPQTEQPQAQTQASQRYQKARWFSVGAKLGYNVALTQDKISHDYDYSLHTDIRHGGSIGINLRLGTNVYCQPEVLYTFACYNASSTIAGDTTTSRNLQNHTIDLPVLLGYSPICSKTFKLRVMAGPRFSFDVNKNKNYDVIQPKQGLTASMRKNRLGLDCGIGLDIWRITVDFRYILMQDIYKYQYQNTETSEWKNVNFLVSTFNISIGYTIWGNNMPSSKKQKYNPDAYDFFNKDRR